MPYDVSVYTAVTAEFAERRRRAELLAEERRAEVAAKVPRLAALDAELAGAAMSVAKAVLAHDAGDLLEGLRLQGKRVAEERARLLTAAGYPADYLETVYVCPLCRDTGSVDAHACVCRERALREEAARRLDEVSGSGRVTFDSFSLDYYPATRDPKVGVVPRQHMARVLTFCRDYTAGFEAHSPSVFFSGGTGLGKTHLSLAIAYAVSDKGFGVVYGSVADLVGAVEREHFSRGGERATLDRLLACDLLILDDLGAEFSTSFSVATLYNLVNTRLQHSRPTVISTNFSIAELTQRYSDRFTSRISGSFRMFGFVGSDIRQQKAVAERR